MKISFSIESSRARKEMPDAIQVKPLSEEQARLINPEGARFTPGMPLPATSAGIEPIIFPPPIGTNLTYGDKKEQYGGTRNDTLRFFADACTPIRVVMEQLKRELRGLAVDVLRKEEDAGPRKKGPQETDPKRDALRVWLRRPDGELMFADWLNAVLEDLLVVGASALARLRTVAGEPVGLRPLDAAIITPILTPTGRSPEAPAPAFYQYAYGLPYREFTRDELLYRPFNRRTWTPYGYSPVEACLMYVILALNRTVWYTNAYSASNLPPGFFTLPDSWSPAMIAEFDKLAVTMAGNTPDRHHAQHYPKGTTYEQVKSDPTWQYEFDEFLMRCFAWAIGVAPTPIVKTNALNQSGSGFSDEAVAGGLKPYQDFIEEMLDDYIASEEVGETCQGDSIPLGFGESEYTVEWIEDREENKDQQLKEDTELVKIAARTLNQIRESRGDEPYDEKEYPEANQPMVLTATGYVPLKGSSEPKPAPIPFGGPPPKGETPPQLAPNAEKLKDQAAATGGSEKADIAKWKRAAKADRRNCRCPREFESAVVPPGTRNWIERNLAFGEVSKAFRTPKRSDVQTFSTSQRTAVAIIDATNWWTKFLKSAAGHYTDSAVAALEKKTKS
ncbi:MAG: hypothetical protein MUO35_03395 [Anaerolineales bacterium]|nr:hypothetical protein [Anaerolineales bacterium]